MARVYRVPLPAPGRSCSIAAMDGLVSYLPEIIWYLTSEGRDMWCRPPYGFFFTTQEAAAKFPGELGVKLELSPIGIASKELVSGDGLDAMRRLSVTRIFLDPQIDPATGDVFGKILRVEAQN